MKKRILTNGINSKKCKFTLAVLICIFALISVSAATSEKSPWIASIEKNGDSVVFADHDDSQDNGGWIYLTGGKEIQLPQPLSFSYSGTNSVEKAGVVIKINKDKDEELKYTYPYSTHPFYTEKQIVKMDYNGPSTFKNQAVNVYLVKGLGVSSMKKALVDAKCKSLGEIFNEGVNYTKTCATLDKCGDLSKPFTFKSLEPGSYGIIITLADGKESNVTKVLSATCFEVVNYELKTNAANTIKEGDNLDVKMSLKDAPADEEFTYGALLINEEAYKAEIKADSNGTINGTDVFVNNIDLRDLGISSINKSELTNGFQTFVGEGNGTVSVGEKNQDTLSLTAFDLVPGNYVLFTGAYEPGKGLVGIDQKKLTIK